MGHTNDKVDAVLIEPHQKHITHQSDLVTMLHTLLDHMREPLMSHKPENLHFLSGPWHNKFAIGSHQQLFAPKVDMRETKHDYYFDIVLPGIHDKSTINIEWKSNRKLLVEGIIDRPSLCGTFDLSRDRDSKECGDGDNGESNETSQEDEFATEVHIPLEGRSIVTEEDSSFEKTEDLFPINIINGMQIDDGDEHIFKIKRGPQDDVLHSHIDRAGSMKPDRTATVTIAERSVGRYMRLFMFPVNVYMGGLQAKLELGLLRINVPKTREVLDES